MFSSTWGIFQGMTFNKLAEKTLTPKEEWLFEEVFLPALVAYLNQRFK